MSLQPSLKNRIRKLEPSRTPPSEPTVVLLTLEDKTDDDVIGMTANATTLARLPGESCEDLMERVRLAEYERMPVNGMPLLVGCIYEGERLA